MTTEDIISFFDFHAEKWDEFQGRNSQVIATILDLGGITEGIDVLDVACGTGFLFPDYKKRKVKSVKGIDISPKMVEKAKLKFPDFDIICADAENYAFEKLFDAVMIYNAFPHFINCEKVVENLAKALKQGGRFTVAHGLSKSELDKIHFQSAGNVSTVLPEAEELASLLTPYFDADVVISDDTMYIVSGIKK